MGQGPCVRETRENWMAARLEVPVVSGIELAASSARPASAWHGKRVHKRVTQKGIMSGSLLAIREDDFLLASTMEEEGWEEIRRCQVGGLIGMHVLLWLRDLSRAWALG